MRRGSAALILTVIVLGFMMAVSTSYVTMVQTETRVQTSVDKIARAKDAAFAGVSYVIARLMATSSTFLVDSTPGSLKKRLYFAYDGTSDSVTNRFGGLNPITDFTNVASSQWIFPDTTGLLEGGETASAVAFRVTSYPAASGTTINPFYYYVKSQGMYRDIEDGITVSATYSAQLLARLRIATLTYEVKLERYRSMEVESDGATADFFTSRPVIFPPPPAVAP
ncbi:hypothetical protein KBA41_00410 [Candidatus Ozemobacteraceae bacterium]|nr:hypothetical protein [Candidatus Ozemobacteraceae bacterium]